MPIFINGKKVKPIKETQDGKSVKCKLFFNQKHEEKDATTIASQ